MIGDYFSKYLIVRRLPNSSTHAVIKELGLVFTELGRPFVLRSDNGPCYSSREFHNFLNFYQVDHVTSSPHYPQSNGFAEALVGIAKKLMDKSLKEGKPWNFGLLQYRTTPISSTLPSPLEMLTGRKPHLNLPQVPSSIGHNTDTFRIRKELLRRQPATSTFHRDPQNWNLDNQFLSRKCMETFGEQLPLTNQLLNQILTGSGFQTTSS